MFTTLQFSQLAAAAWSGPAAAIIASIEHYVAQAGDHTTTSYIASYHLGGICYMGRGECPFEAVAAAVHRYAVSIEALAAQQQAAARAAMRHARRALAAASSRLASHPVRPGFAGRALRHHCARVGRG